MILVSCFLFLNSCFFTLASLVLFFLSVFVTKVTYYPKATPYIRILNADKILHSHFFCRSFLRKIHHYGFQTPWGYFQFWRDYLCQSALQKTTVKHTSGRTKL